jgi:phosphoglycolate phosphatase
MAPSPESSQPTVLFDLDGTVWDSLPGILRSLAHTLATLGIDVPSDEELAGDIGPPLADMLAGRGVPDSQVDEAVLIYRDRYRRLGEFECRVYDGAIDLLVDLRSRRRALGTATSKGVEPTHRMLAHFDLDHRFDAVAAAPMMGTHRKADVIAESLALLGSPDLATVTMVGDRYYDIEGGRSHGLRTVGVTWGYGTADELRRAGADVIVDTFAQLAEVL